MTRPTYTAALGRWQSLASVGSWTRQALVYRAGLTPAISAPWTTLNASFRVLFFMGSWLPSTGLKSCHCSSDVPEMEIALEQAALCTLRDYLESLGSVGLSLDCCDMTNGLVTGGLQMCPPALSVTHTNTASPLSRGGRQNPAALAWPLHHAHGGAASVC